MKYEEILNSHEKAVARKVSSQAEHHLQVSCVTWFRLQYPQLALRLFAIPNGGFRTKTTAARLKDEGALAGVADLFLAVLRGGWGGLFIEMKTTAKGSGLSKAQREWGANVRDDYGYVVCRTLEEFQFQVRRWIGITDMHNPVSPVSPVSPETL